MATMIGLVASVLQLVEMATKARAYFTDFQNAPTDQQRLLLEIQNLEPLIRELDRRISQNQATVSTSGIQAFGGPLIHLRASTERLMKKLDLDGLSKVSGRLTWPLWGKEEVEEGLDTTERFKSLLNAWLALDIWLVVLSLPCSPAHLHQGFHSRHEQAHRK